MDFMLGSKNEAKLEATRKVVGLHFPRADLFNAEVSSGVSDQPFGDEETRLGALTRALRASKLQEDVVGIGLEGGVRLLEEKLYVCNWGAMVLPDGTRFTAGGAQIPLPEEVAQEVLQGQELGVVMDAFSGKHGIRHKEGAIGMFTAGHIERDKLFTHILELLVGQWEYSKKRF